MNRDSRNRVEKIFLEALDTAAEEPSAFVYSLAKPFRGVRYFRLDEPNCDGAKTWEVVKSFLVAGFPVAFGFPVPTSLTADANVPYRPDLDSIRGGQAAVAVGYKSNRFGLGEVGVIGEVEIHSRRNA